MKAICVQQFGAPEVMQLEEVPDPIPAANEVLVKIQAAGVNPVDTYIRAGDYYRLPPLPYVPGSDAAGIIEAIGSEVTAFKAGQRVYIPYTFWGHNRGAYAEKIVRPADELFLLPDNVSTAQGAAVGVPYLTAFRGLITRGQAQAGETVFVHGASGSVGIAAIQLASARGIRTIGSASSEKGRALAIAHGADHVLDHAHPDYLDKLRELTNGKGPEVILEMRADINLDKDLSAVARYGRVVVIGNRGTVEINPRVAMHSEVDILGVSVSECTKKEFIATHAALIAGLGNGTLNPVIRCELPLAQAALAHSTLLERGAYGKIILVP